MSNTSGKIQKNDTLSHSGTKQATRWSFIQSDLSDALTAWNKLEKLNSHQSPDEKELLKIKSIINQLKEKLEQF
jgi:hypothetical protein